MGTQLLSSVWAAVLQMATGGRLAQLGLQTLTVTNKNKQKQTKRGPEHLEHPLLEGRNTAAKAKPQLASLGDC